MKLNVYLQKGLLCYRNAKVLLEDASLLAIRLVLAYGFLEPALQKWRNIDSIPQWFASLGIPFPTFNAYLAAGTELSGVILLAAGLATRLISLPLMVVMLVAITTVHWEHGFAASSNGFEIPLYYLLMLLTLHLRGSGRISLDFLISKARTRLFSAHPCGCGVVFEQDMAA